MGFRARVLGFTLIELLVVIAIIAILAAILFPVFASSRGRAVQAKCISQQKQLGTALSQYASDWDDRMPWAWRWHNLNDPAAEQYSILTALRPYVSQGRMIDGNIRESLWYCTALPARYLRWPSSQQYAYIYYTFFGGGSPGSPLPGSGAPPDRGLMGLAISGPYNFFPFGDPSQGSYRHKAAPAVPWLWDLRIPDKGDAATRAAGGEFPHMNKTVVLFLDGHARTIDEKQRHDPQRSPWFPGSEFSG
jgi:prepilin-type N-terminal cleavage/methylation domain-containing protein/prepilin-type processing-associated H-X9-DG protein